MFSITDLPRNEGVIERDFFAKHSSSSFTLEGYGFHFVSGVTTGPVRGLVPDRLCAAYGSDITFVPCDRESGQAAIAWMERHNVPPQRVDRLRGELEEQFPANASLPELPESAYRADSVALPFEPAPAHRDSIPPPAQREFDTDPATPKAKAKHK
jgi:hypothetical protein